MIPFKLNGKQLQFPSYWEDLTFGQYVRIIEGEKNFIALFTGLDPQTVNKAKIEGLEMIIQCLSFMKKAPDFSKTCNQVGPYKLPLNSKGEFDIQFESLAQFEDMKAAMVKVPENNMTEVIKSYANYVAIYIQKLRDGEYNPDAAIKMVEEVYKMPAHQVIKVGSFFLLKLLNLLIGTTNNSQLTNQNPKKYKPGSRNSKKRSAATRQSRKSR